MGLSVYLQGRHLNVSVMAGCVVSLLHFPWRFFKLTRYVGGDVMKRKALAVGSRIVFTPVQLRHGLNQLIQMWVCVCVRREARGGINFMLMTQFANMLWAFR